MRNYSISLKIFKSAGLSSEEGYKHDRWNVVTEDAIRAMDRLRLQILLPDGRVYESRQSLHSTEEGCLHFDRFYPSDQPPATNDWANLDVPKDSFGKEPLGKPLDLFEDDLVSVNAQFVLADEDRTTADFRVKIHTAHIEREAKHVFYIDVRDRFAPSQRQKIIEGYTYSAVNNLSFEELIDHINRGYTSPRIRVYVTPEDPMDNSVVLDGLDWVISDGTCSLQDDWGQAGIRVNIKDASYFARLRCPGGERELAKFPTTVDLLITTSFTRREMMARLKAQGIRFPENLNWRFAQMRRRKTS